MHTMSCLLIPVAACRLMDMMEEQGGRDDDDRSYSDEDVDSHLMKKGVRSSSQQLVNGLRLF